MKVSIIVPVYRVEKYLKKCIDSILEQTYENLEIILVNDGSPDRCGQICDNYATLDSRIKVINKENGGLSDARNKGVEVATGDYISFVDSDDYIDKNYIRTMVDALLRTNVELICVTHEKFFHEDDSMVKVPEIECELMTAYEALNGKNSRHFITAWGKLVKRSIVEKYPFPIGKLHEDEFVTYKYILETYNRSVAFLNMPLYYYRQREDSIIGHRNSNFSVSNLDAIEAYLEKIDYIKKIGIDESFVVRDYLIISSRCLKNMKKYQVNYDIKKLIQMRNSYYKQYFLKFNLIEHLRIIKAYFL
ncbi:glycosyltransferase family 2 protein [Streptococcus sp. X16XC17]|uniref:glycosyltransferase family 2 protein n=1 Tax=unclassified Streptococcus TaxID=2608887 RepID=UPI00066FDF93|nr:MULTISPECIES: glycosyltransferase family 2 protein [unclassified Streptococcus]TCD46266.1 glycosyltransferase family 2 protein [Streptococcus sp. X16XC17]